jgi:hypothetical protein
MMWPAPQRAGHTTQLITTNEREETFADPKENAFATNRREFAMNITALRVEKQSIEAADMHGQHQPRRKSYREVGRKPRAGLRTE